MHGTIEKLEQLFCQVLIRNRKTKRVPGTWKRRTSRLCQRFSNILIPMLIQVGISTINLIGQEDHVLQPERADQASQTRIFQLPPGGRNIFRICQNFPDKSTFCTRIEETSEESQPKCNSHPEIEHRQKTPSDETMQPEEG